MRTDSYISTLDDLQNWFELNQRGKEPMPFFTIWRGFEAKQDRLIFRNTEISESDKAWELLEEIITTHSTQGGSFRVYLTTKPLFNQGVTTLVRIPGPANTYSPAIAGVQQNYGIYGSPQEMVEAEVKRRMEVYELRQEMEALRADQAAVNGLEQFKQLIQDVPALNNLIHAFGMKMMGMGPNGQPVPVQQTYAATPGAAPADGIQGTEPEGFDYDRVEPALDTLKTVFPDVETTMENLAAWAAKNPDLARTYLSNLNQ